MSMHNTSCKSSAIATTDDGRIQKMAQQNKMTCTYPRRRCRPAYPRAKRKRRRYLTCLYVASAIGVLAAAATTCPLAAVAVAVAASATTTTTTTTTVQDTRCVENPSYISAIGLSCGQHASLATGISCHSFYGLGLNRDDVDELLLNCPKSCGLLVSNNFGESTNENDMASSSSSSKSTRLPGLSGALIETKTLGRIPVNRNRIKNEGSDQKETGAYAAAACHAGWSVTCQDDPTYISKFNLSCQHHQKLDCEAFRDVGFSTKEVFDLVTGCPCACGIVCGTYTEAPSQSPSQQPSEYFYKCEDSQCQDDPTYSSKLSLSCANHANFDCTAMNAIGYSAVDVYELINRCPCACKVSCGTWTLAPSASPSDGPSLVPSAPPTNYPTVSSRPSVQYHPSASPSISVEPSSSPTLASSTPSALPSSKPTVKESSSPSVSVSSDPSSSPTATPTYQPSQSPSIRPSMAPTAKVSSSPSLSHSESPSVEASAAPSVSKSPSVEASAASSAAPTVVSTTAPITAEPSGKPTVSLATAPTTAQPSAKPIVMPTLLKGRTKPTKSRDTDAPTAGPRPTQQPTPWQTPQLTPDSTPQATDVPTLDPTSTPSATPTILPWATSVPTPSFLRSDVGGNSRISGIEKPLSSSASESGEGRSGSSATIAAVTTILTFVIIGAAMYFLVKKYRYRYDSFYIIADRFESAATTIRKKLKKHGSRHDDLDTPTEAVGSSNVNDLDTSIIASPVKLITVTTCGDDGVEMTNGAADLVTNISEKTSDINTCSSVVTFSENLVTVIPPTKDSLTFKSVSFAQDLVSITESRSRSVEVVDYIYSQSSSSGDLLSSGSDYDSSSIDSGILESFERWGVTR